MNWLIWIGLPIIIGIFLLGVMEIYFLIVNYFHKDKDYYCIWPTSTNNFYLPGLKNPFEEKLIKHNNE